jgi:hypothetical protein
LVNWAIKLHMLVYKYPGDLRNYFHRLHNSLIHRVKLPDFSTQVCNRKVKKDYSDRHQ